MKFVLDNVDNILYALGSLCFLAGTVYNMFKGE